MNFIISVIVLAVLILAFTFLPWWIDGIIAIIAAGYFGYRSFKKISNEWVWSIISLVIGITVLYFQVSL